MGIRIRKPLGQTPLTGHTEPTFAPRTGDWHAEARALPGLPEASRRLGRDNLSRTGHGFRGLGIHSLSTAGAVTDRGKGGSICHRELYSRFWKRH
ncbi:MAG: hypothetical protein OSB70_07510 [Myxococcota bacterium]|jgi:hypothetical protein|nr:hypothetical protein [Myxococcota bacterium]